jgi:hypothetical protein
VGGNGSGQWTRLDVKVKTNTLFRIDINDLRSTSGLEPGARGQVWQAVRGVLGNFVLYEVKKDRVLLKYEYQSPDKEAQLVIETIWLDHTVPHFGGKRVWFSCPKCCKRVAVLFRVDRRFRCRKCHKLSYPTQSWDAFNCFGQKAQKIRRRLGGSGALGEDFPSRPKGMHFVTYCKLLQKGVNFERRFWKLADEKVERQFKGSSPNLPWQTSSEE